jgi:hypothetical protein
MVRQIVNVVSAIGEDALVAIDVANTGGGCDYPFESFRCVRGGDAGHGSSLAWAYEYRLFILFIGKTAMRATLFYTPKRHEIPDGDLAGSTRQAYI